MQYILLFIILVSSAMAQPGPPPPPSDYQLPVDAVPFNIMPRLQLDVDPLGRVGGNGINVNMTDGNVGLGVSGVNGIDSDLILYFPSGFATVYAPDGSILVDNYDVTQGGNGKYMGYFAFFGYQPMADYYITDSTGANMQAYYSPSQYSATYRDITSDYHYGDTVFTIADMGTENGSGGGGGGGQTESSVQQACDYLLNHGIGYFNLMTILQLSMLALSVLVFVVNIILKRSA